MLNRLGILVAAALVAAPGVAQEKTPLPSLITANGSGRVKVDPDMATVRVGVQARAKTAQEAQAQANATGQKILAALTKLNIDARDIQTGHLSLYPLTQNVQKANELPEQTIVGYAAANTVTVTLGDIKKVGPVVDAAISAGANEVQGVEFGVKDDASARQSALKKAVADARGKAGAIADGLGMTLGPIFSAEEGGVQVVPMAFGRAAMMDSAATPVAPGQIEISASVTLRYYMQAR